ncbi:TCTEX1 domain-containing protein 1 [Plakobranchus ocellatus]|uniref:TCTEX1 domain-containing protein 1 n=1 Tax=Plakobranchus ocellatus TaxID=259542 RepID=A0AAV4B2J6_9GAST|nr:TCTEX1 domain-containing protein 1 [Plakobranchus ocellatus]
MAQLSDGQADLHSRRRSSVLPMDGLTTGPMRRMSRLDPRASIQYGFSGRRMSHASRSSMSGLSLLNNLKMPTSYQNTYRLEPQSSEKFQSKKAQEVIKSVLESYLSGEKYSKDICGNLAQQISEVIKGRVRELGFSTRYKLVCLVTIGQNRSQGVAVASRSIWNTETDNWASASYSSGDLFAVANIYATYFE